MERIGSRPSAPRRLITALTALLGLALLPSGLWAQVEVGTILDRSGASLQWDSSLDMGWLQKGSNQVSFKPGLSWALLNCRERIDSGPITRGPHGELLFSGTGAAAIESALARDTQTASRARGSARPRIAAIVLDPGHGGRDPGASHTFSFAGKSVDVVEKNIVLDVAHELFNDLKARYPDKRIILTRSHDTYLSLEQRTEIANSVPLATNEAMLFISIHANASFDATAKGFEVWYLPPGYRRQVIDRGSLENGKHDLYPILNSMREEEYSIESVLLGKRILASVAAQVGPAVPDRGLKAQSWFVVRGARMPAVLIELGFVTNRVEASLLSDPSYLKKLARGIYNGVAGFVTYFDNFSGFME